MTQTDLFTQTPKSLEGIIDALEGVDCEEAVRRKGMEKMKELIMHQRIRNEYRVQQKARPNESEQIKSELAEKYFHNPDRVRMINSILYEKYK